MANTLDLLVEIGTEELPPKALNQLSGVFRDNIRQGLEKSKIDAGPSHCYASPRRLAVWVEDVSILQPDQRQERRGPALQAAFDQNGNPTKAALGFARSCGVEVEQLQTVETDKGSWLVHQFIETGAHSTSLIPGIVGNALADLPIPKRMRWADGDEEFVRPVHWVVLLFGDQVIECTILGIKAGNRSYGHRFHHPEPILISEPKNYLTHLRQGKVIADFDERRNTICRQIEQLTQQVSGRAVIDNALLNEVTALVEWPVALMGNFEARFLDIPSEALITTMQDNQKYFPIVDAEGTLLPSFITVSNIESKNPSAIRTGNERVIRPRFSDAEFFWQQDLKTPLESHLEALKKMVFQKKLGSLFDKTERVAKLSRTIAELSDYDADKAERAARLSKCDLLTNMVQEFPALQGTMGYYYAQRAGEVEEIANALKEQYQPRFAGDQIPSSVSGKILALAERIDTLLGIFAIGQTPTGAKDPFALRRSALGIVRILIESDWNLDLRELLHQAALHFAPDIKAYAAIDSVFDFVVERMRGYYAELGFPTDVFEAVLECSPTSPVDFDKRIRAVSAFRERAEAVSLAAANKRIRNILKKSPLSGSTEIDEELLQDVSEQKLARNLSELSTTVIPMTDQGDYAAALSCLASLREPVDRFFDDVMVMVEDDALKNNRIALLSQLSALFLRIADFSRLQS